MYRVMVLAGLVTVLVASVGHCAQTDDLKATVSLISKASDQGACSDYAWSLDGAWSDRWGAHDVTLTVDSDYSRGDDSPKYDRLKTWWRYSLKDQPATKWTPLVLVSTEGDHRADQLQTVAALGLRKSNPHGFVELSLGASKDVRTADPWTGDLGLTVGYERRFGNLGWSLKPQGAFGALGEARLRPDRFLYTMDTSLDYRLTNKMALSYRLQWGNTLADAQRMQFLGLTLTR